MQDPIRLVEQPKTVQPVVKTGTIRRFINKVGRNKPCWCGSGKKYKYCHLNRDQERGLV